MIKIPSINWIKGYKKSDLKGDLTAGITVGIMLIPQGMAYALIAGLPPIYGLYASIIPILIYAFLGTSRQLAVGPVAMVSLLTATGIGTMAEGGTDQYILLAITLALLVGAIQFLLGIFRLGFLVRFLAHPVISGFTSAAALIIGLSQLKHLLGVDLPRSNHIHEILINAFDSISLTHLPTLWIGLGGIGLIMLIKRIKKSFPAALLVVILGVGIVYFLGLHNSGVKIVGEVPEGLPGFQLPILDYITWSSLIYIALAIALVSFMESIAVAKAIQSKHKDYELDPNQELVALGLANVGGAFFQSYPTTGGFSRTAVNNDAGAKTGFASIISVLLIVVTLLFFTPLFYYLPKAVLASIIMVAVFALIDFKEAIHLWHVDKTDFALLISTFLATSLLGIEVGIGIGVALSLGLMIFRSSKPHIAELGRVKGTNTFRNINRFKDLETFDNTLIIRPDAALYFVNIDHITEFIEDKIKDKKAVLKYLLVNAESISHIDSTAIENIRELKSDLENQGITLLFSGIIGPVRDIFEKSNMVENIGSNHFFISVKSALDYTQGNGHSEDDIHTITLQSYH